ncbi:HIRAN domain-containing protein [Arthrobacter sp. Marseille-P9274]|uniref:HIRAN domain-containing protein n=1 Tax=Arthrobacter sp. Marseille-P9274 TaxID=2866572 RepID=UPI0021C7E55B|nr:HIRAN domain-containing protein [Arthrobacter sp. Marseille-P9274]
MERYFLPGNLNWANYEIVGEYYREAQILAALGRKPRLDEQVSEEFEAVLIPEPDNPFDANAISVRIGGHVVGYLGRPVAAEYRDVIHRITASGAVATTKASIWAVRRKQRDWETGRDSTRFHANIRVALPAADQIIPLNNASLSDAAILPWGGALQVTGEDKHFDHLFNYVPTSGEGMVILTMHRLVHVLKNSTEKELVEVRLDGERVGQLTATTSAHYLPTIRHVEDLGKQLGVWAKIKGSGLAADLIIQGARAADLSDGWLRTMPAFPPLVDEALSYSVPPAYTEAERASRTRQQNAGAGALPPASQTREAGTHQPTGRDAAQGATRVRVGKHFVTVTDKDRVHSPGMHKASGISMIVLTVVIGLFLAAIPLLGPVLGLGLLAFGIYVNVLKFRVANALQAEKRVDHA